MSLKKEDNCHIYVILPILHVSEKVVDKCAVQKIWYCRERYNDRVAVDRVFSLAFWGHTVH